jgi:transposase
MRKVDQVHVIRHKVLVEGRSQRQVAKEFGISRVTVRRYVEEPVPGRKETGPRGRPVWEKVGPRIEAWLTESGQWTAGKQQLTRRGCTSCWSVLANAEMRPRPNV